jgi:hypothetical protein
MRTRGNERVSVRQGYGYGWRYGTLNEANLLKTPGHAVHLKLEALIFARLYTI